MNIKLQLGGNHLIVTIMLRQLIMYTYEFTAMWLLHVVRCIHTYIHTLYMCTNPVFQEYKDNKCGIYCTPP